MRKLTLLLLCFLGLVIHFEVHIFYFYLWIIICSYYVQMPVVLLFPILLSWNPEWKLLTMVHLPLSHIMLPPSLNYRFDYLNKMFGSWNSLGIEWDFTCVLLHFYHRSIPLPFLKATKLQNSIIYGYSFLTKQLDNIWILFLLFPFFMGFSSFFFLCLFHESHGS